MDESFQEISIKPNPFQQQQDSEVTHSRNQSNVIKSQLDKHVHFPNLNQDNHPHKVLSSLSQQPPEKSLIGILKSGDQSNLSHLLKPSMLSEDYLETDEYSKDQQFRSNSFDADNIKQRRTFYRNLSKNQFVVMPDHHLMTDAEQLSMPYFSIIDIPVRKYLEGQSGKKKIKKFKSPLSKVYKQGSISVFWQVTEERHKHMRQKINKSPSLQVKKFKYNDGNAEAANEQPQIISDQFIIQDQINRQETLPWIKSKLFEGTKKSKDGINLLQNLIPMEQILPSPQQIAVDNIINLTSPQNKIPQLINSSANGSQSPHNSIFQIGLKQATQSYIPYQPSLQDTNSIQSMNSSQSKMGLGFIKLMDKVKVKVSQDLITRIYNTEYDKLKKSITRDKQRQDIYKMVFDKIKYQEGAISGKPIYKFEKIDQRIDQVNMKRVAKKLDPITRDS